MHKLLAKLEERGLNLAGKLRGSPKLKATGGCADVYLGFLEDGTAVAIKRPRQVLDDVLKRRKLSKVSSFLILFLSFIELIACH